MRILFVSSECAPWAKTGGLGDVSAALPSALGELGHDVRVLMPAYPSVQSQIGPTESTLSWPARDGWPEASLRSVGAPGFTLWLIDCPSLYERPGGPYVDEHGIDHVDNALRFGFLSHVAAELSRRDGPWPPWQADVLHANDWPTGLAPGYVAAQPGHEAATLFTVHNLAFQGEFDRTVAASLQLPDDWLNVDGVLHWERISMLKAGLRYSDLITAVSPTYAAEIKTPEFGCGLDGMLRLRADSLHGVLNGIDATVWNPRTDPLLAARYGPGRWTEKSRNKSALQAECGLDLDPAPLLFGMVSRLTTQKGVDLVLDNLDWLINQGCQFVALGSGDRDLEERLRAATRSHPGRVAARSGFDEELAHLIEAGADSFLMPSRFEPCGLNQMYSMAYGTPPIVHATGGLADTVIDNDGNPEGGTGFVFGVPSIEALREATARAIRTFADKAAWHRLQRRCMARRFDWSSSARQYVALYEQARQGRLMSA